MDHSYKEVGIEFTASFDRATEWLTIVFSRLVLPVVIVYFTIQFKQSPVDASLMLLFLSAIGIYCFVFRPLSYILMPDGIMIHKLIGDIRIPSDHIRKFRRPGTDYAKFVRGMYGSSRISGYFGKYTHRLVGCFALLRHTQRSHHFDGNAKGKIVIAHDHPELFLEEMTRLKELSCAA